MSVSNSRPTPAAKSTSGKSAEGGAPPRDEAAKAQPLGKTLAKQAREAIATVDRLGDFTTDRRVLRLIAMAVVVGAAGSVVAYALQWLIAVITNYCYYGRFSHHLITPSDSPFGVYTVAIPIVGSLIIGFMARYGSERIRGHGIPEAIEAILIGGSRLDFKVAIMKPLSSAVAIGTGGPFGAEGPIIMTGGAFGSLFAQFFNLSASERKALLVAGAAAGMSATFNTPVAAVMIAVELLLFEWKPLSFLPVATASAVAAAVRPLLLGGGPLFPLTIHVALPWWGMLACAGVGIASGIVSGGLTALVYGFEDLFRKLPIHWMWWPAIGGVAIGVGGLIAPRALGVGYDIIGDLLHNQLAIGTVLVLMIVKALIWSIALGSGTSGGVLAPLLIMGGALGALCSQIIPAGDPGYWALIGMAAIMGGTMRSPLTAIVFALELTHDLNAMLPLLIGCSASFACTVLLLKRSILTEKVARRGHHLTREYITDPFETMRVEDVMVHEVNTLPADMPVQDAVHFFTSADLESKEPVKRHKSYPVTDGDGRVIGMVSRSDALHWTVAGWQPTATLGNTVGKTEPLVGYPDELVGWLADRMAAADVGRVPIVRRDDGRLVGIITRKDLLRVRARRRAEELERETAIKLWHRHQSEAARSRLGTNL